jgi:AGZA family xanthine/uracil permease-like MFS transporter
MERMRNSIAAFDSYVGSSTFGRVFRLEGSGHVSTSHPKNFKLVLTSTSGYGDQTYKSLDRISGRTNYVLHNVLHHRCQRELLLQWQGTPLIPQASVLADTGGNCICSTTEARDQYCVNNAEYALCKQGMFSPLGHCLQLTLIQILIVR